MQQNDTQAATITLEVEETQRHPVAQAQPRGHVAAPATQANPAYLLQLAVEQGADLDRLERLMALQQRWEENEAKKAFVAAMAAFKAEPLTIFKRKKVGYMTRDNDFVGYAHAELSDVCEVLVPAMGRHGLSHEWDVKQDAGRVTVSCIITHRLGHSKSVTMDAPPDSSGKKNSIQQIASAMTYLQRYTLLSATGMATTGMDDDGQGSGDDTDQGGAPPPPPPPANRPPKDEPKPYADASFTANLPEWEKIIKAGRKKAEDFIEFATRRGTPMTAEQQAKLREIKKDAPPPATAERDPFVDAYDAAERREGGAA